MQAVVDAVGTTNKRVGGVGGGGREPDSQFSDDGCSVWDFGVSRFTREVATMDVATPGSMSNIHAECV